MDSITQATLGAAVGEAVLGRQIGNRAILWGVVFGTVPDLDVVAVPWQDSIQFLVHHRAASHSLLAICIASPLLAWLFARRSSRTDIPISFSRSMWFFVLVFLTHVLLDCCTNYGTQIWWPFSDTRVAWNNIFIIDPLFTIPMLVCVVACLFLRRTGRPRRVVNCTGIALSTLYLALTFGVKLHVDRVFADSLASQDVITARRMTCPTPLNCMLWYGVAEVDDGYYLGFYSLLDKTREIAFEFVPRRRDLLGEMADSHAVDRLIWFANGFYTVRPHEKGIVLHALNFGRVGFAPNQELYPFSYVITQDDGRIVRAHRLVTPREESVADLLAELWARIRGM